MCPIDIGKEIKEARIRLNMSQEEFGLQINESRQTISNWENNKTRPSYESMALMDEKYGTSFTSYNKIEDLDEEDLDDKKLTDVALELLNSAKINKPDPDEPFVPKSNYVATEYIRYFEHEVDCLELAKKQSKSKRAKAIIDEEIEKNKKIIRKYDTFWFRAIDDYLTGNFKYLSKTVAISITVSLESDSEEYKDLKYFNENYKLCDFKPLSMEELDEIYDKIPNYIR